MLVTAATAVACTLLQFRGDLTPTEQVTMISTRSGLSMDIGAKVTYNGVQIGRVGNVEEVGVGGQPRAKITLDLEPKYLNLIPRNVEANISATTMFGNKYVSFAPPENPTPQRITASEVIDATKVSTEINTLFETMVSVAQQVDPIKLNQTLAATAQALDGLGDRFGQSIADGNDILADVNPQLPQLRRDGQLLADLGDTYTDAAPDLFDGLQNAATVARTLNDNQADIDQVLMAAIGFGNTGGDIVERSSPYLVRGGEDLLPTSQLFDEHSPALLCTIRNFHDVEPKISASVGGNGYSAVTSGTIVGPGNPYVYPDNLPRINAHGGPEGRPGCWQPVTRDLWPAPYLVMDTGASIAPYNHAELGQPSAIEHVWGRQIGENAINP